MFSDFDSEEEFLDSLQQEWESEQAWFDGPNDDGWTEEEEQQLLADGICPECGAEIAVCRHLQKGNQS